MGWCTLIDIHHDCIGEIQRDPRDFALAIATALSSGDRSEHMTHWLRRYGVTLIDTRDSYAAPTPPAPDPAAQEATPVVSDCAFCGAKNPWRDGHLPTCRRWAEARPLAEWHEDMDAVLWWRFPIEEPPFVGTPLDSDWPGYHTHFTALPPCPAEPAPGGEEGGR